MYRAWRALESNQQVTAAQMESWDRAQNRQKFDALAPAQPVGLPRMLFVN
jgi:hypothetical protein